MDRPFCVDQLKLKRLPCGGSVTSSNDGAQVIRVTRQICQAESQATFILLHPPKLARGETDQEIDLCVEFARLRGHGRAVILYLFPYRSNDMAAILKQPVPWGTGPEPRRIQDLEVMHSRWPGLGGIVIAAWGDEGRNCNMDRVMMRRCDGSPRGFDWRKTLPKPVHALGLTPTGAPARISADNVTAEPMLYWLTAAAAPMEATCRAG